MIAAAKKAILTVSVGDATTLFLLRNGVTPSVAVVDFFEKRSPTSELHARTILSAKWIKFFVAANPAGTISSGALLAVREALSFSRRGKNSLVVIEGEEDLVFLAAALHAPAGALLLYGQPNKGIVMLKAGKETKKQAEKILGQAFKQK